MAVRNIKNKKYSCSEKWKPWKLPVKVWIFNKIFGANLQFYEKETLLDSPAILKTPFYGTSKAVLQRCSYEKVFLKYAVDLQENIYAKVCFQHIFYVIYCILPKINTPYCILLFTEAAVVLCFRYLN